MLVLIDLSHEYIGLDKTYIRKFLVLSGREVSLKCRIFFVYRVCRCACTIANILKVYKNTIYCRRTCNSFVIMIKQLRSKTFNKPWTWFFFINEIIYLFCTANKTNRYKLKSLSLTPRSLLFYSCISIN